VLDQQVAPARPVAEQCLHLIERRRIGLAAFRRLRRAAPAGTVIFRGSSGVHVLSCCVKEPNSLLENNPSIAIV
jgi:hypothetical protein